jgi:23S rRNA (guanosine2251-2'-O)-methyltransferase
MARDVRRTAVDPQLVYGKHAVRHLLTDTPEVVLEVWIQQDLSGVQDLTPLLAVLGVAVQTVPRRTLDRLTAGANHQGVVVRRQPLALLTEADLDGLLGQRADVPFVLILEAIEDPHNLGACLRSAEAAGVDAVVLPLHRGCGITPTVSKVACGAAQRVPIVQARNLARVLRNLREAGVTLIGTVGGTGQSLYDLELVGPTALVMGGEEQGLRQLTRELCDSLVDLPLHGQIESLNVSVATGICLYEVLRQRRHANKIAAGP